MQKFDKRVSATAFLGDAEPVMCPKCGRHALRIRRRPLDRVVSVFGTVWRFRCSDPACDWAGNVRMRPMRIL
jgi:hypothetical protein